MGCGQRGDVPQATAATGSGYRRDGDAEERLSDPAGVAQDTGFKFLRPIKVIFRDLDGMRHVNHAVYLSYCEAARNEYWIRVTGIRNVEEYDFVLAELTARYLAPAQLGDDLMVACRVTELRRSSFIMQHAISRLPERQPIFEMTSVQVMFDYATGMSIPISDLRRRQIESFEGRSLSSL